MTAAGPGELIRIEGHLTSSQYVNILQNSFLPSVKMLFGTEIIYFVQDRSPIHTSRLTVNYLSETQLKVINWPGRAPDLNPMENLWAEMAKNVDPGNCHTPDELWENICISWNEIRKTSKCEVIVNSMPRRIKSVIEQGGFWTKY